MFKQYLTAQFFVITTLLFSQTDYVIWKNSGDTIFGEIKSRSIFLIDNQIEFKQSKFNSFTKLNSNDIEAYYHNNQLYVSKIVSENDQKCLPLFLRQEINDCMKLYFFMNKKDTIYFLQKSDYPLVEINRKNIQRTAHQFFRENSIIANKFKNSIYTIDSLYNAVNEYNYWSKLENPLCNFEQTTGWFKMWENLSLNFDIGFLYGKSIKNGYHNQISNIYGGELGAKIDIYNHKFSFKLLGGIEKMLGTNNIGTKNIVNQYYFGLATHVNHQFNNNPFDNISFYLGGKFSFLDYIVEAEKCNCDNYLIDQSNGFGLIFGINRQFKNLNFDLRYNFMFLNSLLNNEGISKSIDAGFNPKIQTNHYNWQTINIILSYKIYSLSWFRQIKTTH